MIPLSDLHNLMFDPLKKINTRTRDDVYTSAKSDTI